MEIIRALQRATRDISESYFFLPIVGRDQPIKRERVYCYELFHQLRLAMKDCQLTLTGEPDKRGHPDFPPINPDFILHTPGTHDENTAVVEVECCVNLNHLAKDLRNLKKMRDKGYKSLVLLLFANQEVPWLLLEQASTKENFDINNVIILLHRSAGESATREFPPVANER